METEIKRLVSLAKSAKKAAQCVFSPSCFHKSVDENTRIYFSDGYDTFSITIGKIEMSLYGGKISFPLDTKTSDLNTAISNLEISIADLEQRPILDKEKEKAEEIERLHKQIEILKNS